VVASRAGRAEQAEELLRAARDGFERIGARIDVTSTDLSVAEARLRGGDVVGALAIVERLEATPGVSEQIGAALPTLHGRVLIQRGTLDAAHEMLQRALAAARESGNDFEIVLALDALDAARAALGHEPDLLARDEAAEVLRRLDIIALPVYSGFERSTP
jgi:phosphatidylserine/phosphatidylglycerophosphate/cardiolipin synthase-like enzyme